VVDRRQRPRGETGRLQGGKEEEGGFTIKEDRSLSSNEKIIRGESNDGPAEVGKFRAEEKPDKEEGPEYQKEKERGGDMKNRGRHSWISMGDLLIVVRVEIRTERGKQKLRRKLEEAGLGKREENCCYFYPRLSSGFSQQNISDRGTEAQLGEGMTSAGGMRGGSSNGKGTQVDSFNTEEKKGKKVSHLMERGGKQRNRGRFGKGGPVFLWPWASYQL